MQTLLRRPSQKYLDLVGQGPKNYYSAEPELRRIAAEFASANSPEYKVTPSSQECATTRPIAPSTLAYTPISDLDAHYTLNSTSNSSFTVSISASSGSTDAH